MSREPDFRYVGDYVQSQFERGRQALEEGVYDRAIELFSAALRARGVTPEIEAMVRCSLSEAYEEDLKGQEALDAVVKYESLAARDALPVSLQALVWLRVGRAYHRLAQYPTALSYLNTALKLAQSLADAAGIGQAHLALGRSYWMMDEFHLAHDHLDQAVEYFRQLGDRRLLSMTYLANGLLNIREGKYDEAVTLLESGERLISDKPYYSLLGQIMQNRAAIGILQQRSREAIVYQERSIAYYERAGQRGRVATGLNNLALSLFHQGEIDRAEAEWQQAAALTRELAKELGESQTSRIESMVLDGLAQVDILRGNYAAAETKLQTALGITLTYKRKWDECLVRQSLTQLYCAQGARAAALNEASINLALAEQLNDDQALLTAQLCASEAQLLNDQLETAEVQLGEIEERLRNSKDLVKVGQLRRLRARCLAAQRQYSEAAALAAQSASAFQVLDDKYQVGLSQLEQGQYLLQAANPAAARPILEAAAGILTTLKATVDAARAAEALHQCAQVVAQPSHSGSFQLASAERLLDAAVSRELLLRELALVLHSLPSIQRLAVFEVVSVKDAQPLTVEGWSPDAASRLLQMAQMSSSLTTGEGKIRLHWLEPERRGGRAALLVEAQASASEQLYVLLRLVQQGLELCTLRQERTPRAGDVTDIGEDIANSVGLLVGSVAMRQLLEAIHRIRSSNVTVLITGESGTGKELVARAVHAESARRSRAFVPFNCTTATRDLADSLLFGHKRGAFTGATEDRLGVVRAADGGTLFLDEIGDLTLEVQPKLLRFLQEGEVQPLGIERPLKVDVRVIAATNAELERLVEQGRFREDLFHRLNVIRLRVPALRERREEVPMLARHFLSRFAKESRKNLSLADESADLLQVFDWPGNVRQLSNEMRRIAALAEDGATVTHHDLSPEIIGPIKDKIDSATHQSAAGTNVVAINVKQPMSDAVSELEREMLLTALRANKGNISRTARQLGLTRRGLHLKRERLGIQDFARDAS